MKLVVAGRCLAGLCLIVSTGCMEERTEPAAKAKLKTTDDIGEYTPEEGQETVDSKVKVSNPITAPLEAYEPLKQQVAEMGVTHAVQMFHALEGRYPKDHDEFMTKVIRQNNIRLPALGAGKRYEYDVANHQLMVVRDAEQKQ
ncbi:MAG: hypothetical protein RIK87_23000 [Fuerstiella sp.]